MVLLSLTRDYNISPGANRLALGRSGNQAHGSEKNSVFRPDRRAWATSHSALMSLADVPIQRKVQALPRFEFDGASDAERDTYRGTERSLVKSENAVRPSVQQKTGVQATVCLHNPLLPGIRPQNLQARGCAWRWGESFASSMSRPMDCAGAAHRQYGCVPYQVSLPWSETSSNAQSNRDIDVNSGNRPVVFASPGGSRFERSRAQTDSARFGPPMGFAYLNPSGHRDSGHITSTDGPNNAQSGLEFIL